jgi:hypothetical protein
MHIQTEETHETAIKWLRGLVASFKDEASIVLILLSEEAGKKLQWAGWNWIVMHYFSITRSPLNARLAAARNHAHAFPFD